MDVLMNRQWVRRRERRIAEPPERYSCRGRDGSRPVARIEGDCRVPLPLNSVALSGERLREQTGRARLLREATAEFARFRYVLISPGVWSSLPKVIEERGHRREIGDIDRLPKAQGAVRRSQYFVTAVGLSFRYIALLPFWLSTSASKGS
jgi:hypothetical protein